MKNLTRLLGIIALAAVMGTGIINAQTVSPDSAIEGKEYKVGDTGPAGGIIFYVKKDNSDGWRYLEAAPYDINVKCQWGVYKDSVETGGRVGDGKNNSQRILLALSRRPTDIGRAAELCDRLEIGGFDGWFLPSLNELSTLFKAMQFLNKLGNFKKEFYWTSTQKHEKDSFVINMGTGKIGDKDKDHKHNVRAIRSF
ncbi:MAG: DUF1566 domain-containing protein [Treponema sp.]|nr:DUF1566 domain-containing protein [Treponema sp.]